jgi:hypothetical protein
MKRPTLIRIDRVNRSNIPPTCSPRRRVACADLQNNDKTRVRQAPSYRSAPCMPNIAPQWLTLW